MKGWVQYHQTVFFCIYSFKPKCQTGHAYPRIERIFERTTHKSCTENRYNIIKQTTNEFLFSKLFIVLLFSYAGANIRAWTLGNVSLLLIIAVTSLSLHAQLNTADSSSSAIKRLICYGAISLALVLIIIIIIILFFIKKADKRNLWQGIQTAKMTGFLLFLVVLLSCEAYSSWFCS